MDIKGEVKRRRDNLRLSLTLYRFAIISGHISELPFLYERVKEDQLSFEKVYRK
ncbi:hypothetical protein [Aliivibrio fischeri]|uniref:hypothetical protein n=1 Tax=Aliivibrio fischeri TaxID=668 RepID=UPI000B1D45F3|nr:hypothetical protein [Aliivibrio fischeri]